jgi:integrase
VRKRRDAHLESDARDSAEDFILVQDFFRNRFGVADEQRAGGPAHGVELRSGGLRPTAFLADLGKRVRIPWIKVVGSLPGVQRDAKAAAIDRLGTHSPRHSYRSWLDAVGTAIAVQQKLMRHSDIRTTLNIYGDVVTNEMAEAHAKIVRLALPRAS